MRISTCRTLVLQHVSGNYRVFVQLMDFYNTVGESRAMFRAQPLRILFKAPTSGKSGVHNARRCILFSKRGAQERLWEEVEYYFKKGWYNGHWVSALDQIALYDNECTRDKGSDPSPRRLPFTFILIHMLYKNVTSTGRIPLIQISRSTPYKK